MSVQRPEVTRRSTPTGDAVGTVVGGQVSPAAVGFCVDAGLKQIVQPEFTTDPSVRQESVSPEETSTSRGPFDP